MFLSEVIGDPPFTFVIQQLLGFGQAWERESALHDKQMAPLLFFHSQTLTERMLDFILGKILTFHE